MPRMYYDKNSGARLFEPTAEEVQQKKMSDEIEDLKKQVAELTAKVSKKTTAKTGE